MPFYEYRCDACGHDVEALQKVNDDPLVDCPTCGAATLRRIVSAPAFRLKGTGWYATDFKNNGTSKAGSSGKDKGESKPDSGSSTEASGGSTEAATCGAGACPSCT